MNKAIFILVLFLTNCLNAQTQLSTVGKSTSIDQSKINLETYNTIQDSLQKLKSTLLTNRTILKNEIDSLKNLSFNLDEKIESINKEIEGLFVRKFGKENGVRLFNKQIWKGMTDKMLLVSWGKPDRIDKNIEKWGTFTQWYYGKITFFFRDGKLIDFEESK